MRILIVDDEPAMHDSYRRSFAAAPAASGELDAMAAELFGETAAIDDALPFALTHAMQGAEAVTAIEAAIRDGDPVRGRVHRRAHAAGHRRQGNRDAYPCARSRDQPRHRHRLFRFLAGRNFARGRPRRQDLLHRQAVRSRRGDANGDRARPSLAWRPGTGGGARHARRASRAIAGTGPRTGGKRKPRDPHGEPRFADGSAQPTGVSPCADRPCTRADDVCRRDARSRPVQVGQRYTRPSGGRRTDSHDLRDLAGASAGGWLRRAAGW